jgi:hypothetical protein
MKRLKFLSFILLSTLVLSLTSCLGNDSSSSGTYAGVFKVYNLNGQTYFASGTYKIIPSTTSLATMESTYGFNITSGLAYIVYSYDSSNQTSSSSTSSSTTTTLNVDLTYAESLNVSNRFTISTTRGSANDSIATQPIIQLNQVDASSSACLSVFDSHFLLMLPDYMLSNAYHYFTLVYYPNETKTGDTEMTLYLRHRSNDQGTTYTSINMVGGYFNRLYYKVYDIENFLDEFRAQAGALPTKITVSTAISSSLDVNDATEQKYSTTYSTSN